MVLNAANEVAVARFLDGRLGFTSIPDVIERTMDAHRPVEVRRWPKCAASIGGRASMLTEIARGVELKV